MNYYFDSNGWLTVLVNPNRSTDVTPQAEAGGLKNNWTGTAWVLAAYVAPVPPTTPAPDPRMWQIDVGPFKDRLGMDALAIGSSDNAACRAVKEMMYDRKYIDLKGAQTASMLDLLIATAQPTINPMFAGSGPMTLVKKAAILNTPTTDAERNVKGLA